ncbi:hypothetical protein ANO11243_092590 [Dothideomycetidae sp. 11243]|nr:hypothetical protein ANO11243_092590 [fungal sp. No.11243]
MDYDRCWESVFNYKRARFLRRIQKAVLDHSIAEWVTRLDYGMRCRTSHHPRWGDDNCNLVIQLINGTRALLRLVFEDTISRDEKAIHEIGAMQHRNSAEDKDDAISKHVIHEQVAALVSQFAARSDILGFRLLGEQLSLYSMLVKSERDLTIVAIVDW